MMNDPWTNPYRTEEMEVADEHASDIRDGDLILRLQRSSKFLRENETPPRPIANVIRQSIADAIDEAISRLSDDE